MDQTARSDTALSAVTDNSITIIRPDDWHVHLREGPMMRAVLPYTANKFGRAIIMPNLVPPVVTAIEVEWYRRRIKEALPEGSAFTPLMTGYLTDNTDPDDVEQAFREGIVVAYKVYPAGATTNSAAGVTDIKKAMRALERAQKIGMPILFHGEVTDPSVDIFDREAVWIERILIPIRKDFPGLKVVMEHITTKDAVDYAMDQPNDGTFGATITPHHLKISRNALFEGGLRPHKYCLPVAKREMHRIALRVAATSGLPYFFLGTDSAPHPLHRKEAECCAAGCFVAPAALELYAEVFEEEGKLDKLEAFASKNGPKFYGLPENKDTVTLVRKPWQVPEVIPADNGEKIRPFMAGETLGWSVA